ALLTSLVANHTNFRGGVDGGGLPFPDGTMVIVSSDEGTDGNVVSYVVGKLKQAGYVVAVDRSSTKKLSGVDDVEVLFDGEQGVSLLKDKRGMAKLFKEKKVSAVFALNGVKAKSIDDTGYLVRRAAVDLGVGLVNEPRGAVVLADAVREYQAGERTKDEAVLSWGEWVGRS
ncbi:hypothetical protein HDU76_012129, partial [Blyttiomyces sp. JEL0837]